MSAFETEISKIYKSPTVNPCTQRWIEQARQWHIVYRGFLHNHMTHNLAVIGSLGLTEVTAESKMKWWYDLYCEEPLDPSSSFDHSDLEINNNNWKVHVLTSDADDVVYYSYLRYFDGRIKEYGSEHVVREHLPFLVDGLAGSAVHPIIHLGFGLEVKADSMIAEGLACMCVYYLSLSPSIPSRLTDISVESSHLWVDGQKCDLLEASLHFIDKALSEDYHTIAETAMNTTFATLPVSQFQRMVRSFTTSEYLGSCFNDHLPLALSGSMIENIKQATALIACAYLASDSEFFVIHGLTSLHGLIVSLQYLTEDAQRCALVTWWKTCMAVLVVQSVIRDDKMRNKLLFHITEWRNAELATDTSEPSVVNEVWWSESLSVSVTSTDEHASKGCYVLYRWSHFTGMPAHSLSLFREVAANQIKGCPEEGNPAKNIWFSS